jgi:hypothetical protein
LALVPIHNGHVGSLLGKRQGDGAADAAVAARDEGDAVAEPRPGGRRRIGLRLRTQKRFLTRLTPLVLGRTQGTAR